MSTKAVPYLKILVICTGNSCRSQMAEGYFRALGNDRVVVASAGTEAHGLNPIAIAVMREDDVDIGSHSSDTIDKYQNKHFDYVITVCDNAREKCPWFPGKTVIHHSFPDPADATGSEEEILQTYREVRNSIKDFVLDFLKQK